MKRNVEVPRQIKEAFEAKRNECVLIARQRTGKEVPMFRLVFSQMGRRAGVCSTVILTGESTIKINPDYFRNPKDYAEQLGDTVPHEIAHAVVAFLYPTITESGRRRRQVDPHGREWYQVMAWFGIPRPSVRHKMDMTGVAVRKVRRPFNYLCGCGLPHPLTFQMHNKIQLKGRVRICKRCKQKLIYERQWGKPVINLNVEQVTPKVTLVNVVPPKPSPPATHRTVTRFINGSLQNVRIPIEPGAQS